jgi:predicted lipid-binding transport protein (Tim44 family)
MNEAADVANNIPAVVLLSLWWAFLSTLDLLFTPAESEKPDRAPAKPPDDDAADPREAELRKLDPTFDRETFLSGAKRAYETVLNAYALGDLKTLRSLLSPEVLKAFADACALRQERQETLELTFIGLETASITDIESTADAIEITVLFRALIVSAERSAKGDIIGGNPAAVTLSADLWTFSRPVPAVGNAWIVVATDEGETADAATNDIR